jgi:uncharacterized protein (TIGR02594 family)
VADSYDIKVRVDGTGAESGLRKVDTSLKGTIQSLRQFDGAAKSAFGSLQQQVAKSSNFNSLAKNLDTLSQAFAKLKGASVSPALARNIGALSTAMRGFKAPSAGQTAGLSNFLRAVNQARVTSNTVNNLKQLAGLSALSGFRAPSAASVRNLGMLINVLSTGDPARITRMIHAMQGLNGFTVNIPSGALNQLTRFQQQMNRMNAGRRGQIQSPIGSGFLGGLRSGTMGLKGFENQLSASYQMSSLFRTALGSLTLGALTSSVLQTSTNLNVFKRSLQAVATSSSEVAEQMAFVDKTTRDMPISLETAMTGFSKFNASARLSGASVKQVQTVFTGLSAAFAAFHLSPEAQGNAMLAVEQMYSKGTIQAEELKRQLSQYIPGAYELLAQSMGMTTAKMTKLMQEGKIGAENMELLAKSLMQLYGPQLAAANRSATGQIQQLSNSWTRFKQNVAEGGFEKGLASFLNILNNAISSNQLEALGTKVGQGFQTAFGYLSAAAQLVIDNWKLVTYAIGGGGVLVALKLVGGLAMSLLTPFGMLLGAGLKLGSGLAMAFRVAIIPITALSAVLTSPVVLILAIVAAAVGLGVAISAACDVAAASIRNMVSPETLANFRAFRDEWFGFTKYLNTPIGDLISGKGPKPFDNLPQDAKKPAGEAGDVAGKGFMDNFMKTITGNLSGLKGLLGSAGVDMSGMDKALDDYKKQVDLRAQDNDLQNYNYDIRKGQEEALLKMKEESLELTKQEQQLLDRIDPIAKAKQDLKESQDLIQKLVSKGKMTPEQGTRIGERVAYLDNDKIDPAGAKIKKMQEEYNLLHLSNDQREIEKKYLADREELIKAGYGVSEAEKLAAALKEVNKSMQDLEKGGSNGFQRWANGVKDFRESLIDVETNAISGLSDSLTDLVTTGKADFASLGQSILRSINKAIIDSMLKDIFKNFNGNSMLAGLFGEKGPGDGQAALDAASKVAAGSKTITDGIQSAATMDVQAGVVNVNGSPLGAAGAGLGGANPLQNAVDSSGKVASPAAAALAGGSPAAKAAAAAAGTGAVATGVRPAVIGNNSSKFDAAFSSAVSGTNTNPALRAGLASKAAALNGSVGAGGTIAGGDRRLDSVAGAGESQALGDYYKTLPPGFAAIHAGQSSGIAGGDARLAGTVGAGLQNGNLSSQYAISGGDARMGGAVPGIPSLGGGSAAAARAAAVNPAPPREFIPGTATYPQTPLPPGMVGSGAGGVPSNAVDLASTKLGMSETANNADINSFLKAGGVNIDAAQTAWCAGFVNSSLKQVGIEGTGKLNATSFQKWGTKVDPSQGVMRGDVLVNSRGHGPNEAGGHVGFATGQSRVNPQTGEQELQMLSGNSGNKVTEQWYKAQQLDIRRAQFTQGQPGMPGMGGPGQAYNPLMAGGSNALGGAGQQVQQAAQQTAQAFQQQMTQNVTPQITQGLSTAFGPAAAPIQQLTTSVGQIGPAAQDATGGLGGMLQQLMQMGQGGMGGGGGAGGLLSGLGSLFAREGGAPGNFLSGGSAYGNSYAEGTESATRKPGSPHIGNGFAATLHDNEAVVPLSRGRSIPVEMPESGGGNQTNNHITLNINGVKDAAGFNKSKAQIGASMAASMNRMASAQN